MQEPVAIIPLSEQCVLVQWAQVIDVSINEAVIALHKAINHQPFTGFTETVPAYASLAVYYNVMQVRQEAPQAFAFVKEQVQHYLHNMQVAVTVEEEIIEIPVRYGGSYGPDIDEVAATNGISVEELVRLHTAGTYRVFMIGFMPGFAYMGITHEKLFVNRKAQPRTVVPAGSVGLAGHQTGIYPFTSPGGWQIIGHTTVQLFDVQKDPPCLLQAGRQVRFISI